MRRTQARLVDLPPPGTPLVLAAVPCRRCAALGATVVALGRDERGVIELAWCSIEHAKLDGWPWLRAGRLSSERRRGAGGARSPPPASHWKKHRNYAREGVSSPVRVRRRPAELNAEAEPSDRQKPR